MEKEGAYYNGSYISNLIKSKTTEDIFVCRANAYYGGPKNNHEKYPLLHCFGVSITFIMNFLQ
jgi:hypothetical protein